MLVHPQGMAGEFQSHHSQPWYVDQKAITLEVTLIVVTATFIYRVLQSPATDLQRLDKLWQPVCLIILKQPFDNARVNKNAILEQM